MTAPAVATDAELAFFDALTELVHRGAMPGVMDDVAALLRRGRGRARAGRKRAEQAKAEPPKTEQPVTPKAQSATPERPPAQPRIRSTPVPLAVKSSRPPTAPKPTADRTPHEENGRRSAWRWGLVAGLVALVVLLVMVLAGCASGGSSEVPQNTASTTAAEKPTVTLTLGAIIVGRGGVVTYSCPGASDDVLSSCGPLTVGDGLWTVKVTVPVGVTVRVQAGGGMSRSCWISDELDKLTLDRDDSTGQCEAQAR